MLARHTLGQESGQAVLLFASQVALVDLLSFCHGPTCSQAGMGTHSLAL